MSCCFPEVTMDASNGYGYDCNRNVGWSNRWRWIL